MNLHLTTALDLALRLALVLAQDTLSGGSHDGVS